MMTITLSNPFARTQCSDMPAVQEAQALAAEHRNKMVATHMPLVRYVAGSMSRHAGASAIVDHDDLVGYGSEGLIEAVDTFDPTRGVKFSTWGVLHIRTTILEALRNLDPLPRSLRTKGKAIEAVSYDLANRNGHWPQDSEVAAEIGLPLATLRMTLQHLGTVVISLDSSEDADGTNLGYTRISSLADEDPEVDPERSLATAETGALLAEAVAHLPERERSVVVACYYQGYSLRDIADELGVSASRISQLHARALKLLRTYITASLEDAPRICAA